MACFLVAVLSSYKHTCFDVPTPYPALCDASHLAICTVCNPFFLVNTQSLVLGYRWNSCPSGPAVWYCTLSSVTQSVRSAFEKLWPCLCPPPSYLLVFGKPCSSGFPRVRSTWTVLLHPPCWHLTAVRCHLICLFPIAGTITAEWLSWLGGSPRLLQPLRDLLYGHPSLRLPRVMV